MAGAFAADVAAFIVKAFEVVGAFGKLIGGGCGCNEGREGAADFLAEGGLWHGESGSSEGETRPLVTRLKSQLL